MKSNVLKKFVVGLFVIAACAPSNTHAQTKIFGDVDPHDWFYSYTSELAATGIISTNSNFLPYGSLTRAELAKMAVKAAEYQRVIVTSSPQKPTFCDVPSNHWAASYIETLVNYSVVQGTPARCTQGKDFFPENTISRAEALKMLLGTYGIPAEGNSSFSDVVHGSWYEPYVAKAVSIGLVNGYSDGTFHPQGFISRAEMSKILVRLMQHTDGKTLN